MIQVRSLIKTMTLKLMRDVNERIVEIEKAKQQGTYVPSKEKQ